MRRFIKISQFTPIPRLPSFTAKCNYVDGCCRLVVARQPSIFHFTIHCTNPSIQPSIFFHLFGVGTRGRQPNKGRPDFPLPSSFVQHFWGDPGTFTGQLTNIVPSLVLGLLGGFLPEGHALSTSLWKHPG